MISNSPASPCCIFGGEAGRGSLAPDVFFMTQQWMQPTPRTCAGQTRLGDGNHSPDSRGPWFVVAELEL